LEIGDEYAHSGDIVEVAPESHEPPVAGYRSAIVHPTLLAVVAHDHRGGPGLTVTDVQITSGSVAVAGHQIGGRRVEEDIPAVIGDVDRSHSAVPVSLDAGRRHAHSLNRPGLHVPDEHV